MSDDSCGCGCNTTPKTEETTHTNDDCACGCECCGEQESPKEDAVA